MMLQGLGETGGCLIRTMDRQIGAELYGDFPPEQSFVRVVQFHMFVIGSLESDPCLLLDRARPPATAGFLVPAADPIAKIPY